MTPFHRGGAIALALLLTACAKPTTTPLAPPPTIPAPSAPAARTPQPSARPAAVGQPVKDGKLTFTVTKAGDGPARLGDQYASYQPQGRFYVIHVAVTNHANEAQMFVGSAQKLYAGQAQYSADDKAAIYMKDINSSFQQVNPGNSLTAVIVYDIPKSVRPDSIEFHDSPFSGGARVTL